MKIKTSATGPGIIMQFSHFGIQYVPPPAVDLACLILDRGGQHQ